MLADSFQQTVSHLQKYINYINGLAYRDALTGVKNKTAYQETIANLEERTRTGRPEFAMIVFDINNLKIINDTLGHDFGDILIIDSCKLICKVFKRSPVYRIGGDEFVVILENDDFNKYEELLARFKQRWMIITDMPGLTAGYPLPEALLSMRKCGPDGQRRIQARG